jgi:hypothetical protein
MKTIVISGIYRETAGGVSIRSGKLHVYQRDGRFHDVETGSLVRATSFALTDRTTAVDITSQHGVWHFDPDAGECERIGLPIFASE